MRAFKTRILIASALTIGAISFFSTDVDDNKRLAANGGSCPCNTSHIVSNVSQQCTQPQQSSWFSWISGDSRSAQFHYLDLLELLTSQDEQKQVSSSLKSHF